MSTWVPVLRAMWSAFPQRMALGAALATLTVLMSVGLLGLSGWFIAATAIAGLHIATALVFDVFMPSAGIRLLALGRTGARYGERLVTHDAALATLAVLREQLFLGFANSAATSAVAAPVQQLFRITADLDALESLPLRVIIPILAATGVALFCGLVLGLMQPWVGVAMAMALLVAGLGIFTVLAISARRSMVARGLALEILRAKMVDLVSGQTDLLMTRSLARQRRALAFADQRLARIDRRLNRLDLRAASAYSIAGGCMLALVLMFVGFMVEQQRIGAPGAALAILVTLGAMEPFSALRRGGLEAGRTWLAARRLAQPLSSSAIEQSPVNLSDNVSGDPLIVEQLSVRYPSGLANVLHDVSIRVSRGERVAVVGPSGSGKSTLIATITGEMQADTGRVHVSDYAWLSQRTALFNDSARDNLGLAAPMADDDTLWRALDAAHLAPEIHAAGGLDTVLGEDALGLSGGQARRLALARLLLQDRAVWLLDEPTEGLDTSTAAAVLKTLDLVGAGRSWLLVTHLRREAELADRLVVLRAGRVVAECARDTPQFKEMLNRLRND